MYLLRENKVLHLKLKDVNASHTQSHVHPAESPPTNGRNACPCTRAIKTPPMHASRMHTWEMITKKERKRDKRTYRERESLTAGETLTHRRRNSVSSKATDGEQTNRVTNKGGSTKRATDRRTDAAADKS